MKSNSSVSSRGAGQRDADAGWDDTPLDKTSSKCQCLKNSPYAAKADGIALHDLCDVIAINWEMVYTSVVFHLRWYHPSKIRCYSAYCIVYLYIL